MNSSGNISTISMTVNPKNVLKFDDAMSLTGFGKYNILMTVLCGFVSMAVVLETIGFSYIIPAAQCDLELTLTQKGYLTAIPFIGLISASQFWGYMADTRGRRKILMISMTLGSVFSMISSFSPNLTYFIVLRFFSSALMAATNAVIYTYYGEFTPKAYADAMISVLSSIIIFSAAVSTLIAWGVLLLEFELPIDFLGIVYRPWRLIVVCYAFPFLLSTLAMSFAPESPKFLMNQGKNEDALEILRSMYRTNSGRDISQYQVDAVILDEIDRLGIIKKDVSAIRSLWNQTVPLFKPPLLKYMIIFFTIAFGVYSCANAFYMWLPDIIDRFYIAIDTIGTGDGKTFCELMDVRNHIESVPVIIATNNNTMLCDDSLNSSTYPMMLGVIIVISFVNIFVAVSLRWTQKKTILTVVFVTACSSALVMHWITNYYISWTMMFIFLSCGCLMGIISAYAVEVFPTIYRATAVSLIMMFGRIGSVFGANLVGFLMEVYCPANFFGFGSLLFVCTICCLLLPGTKNKIQSKDQR